jgi:uncharacterized membrane protein YkoI
MRQWAKAATVPSPAIANLEITMIRPVLMFLLAAIGSCAFAARPLSPETKFPATKVPLETCLKAALKERAGTVMKVELKLERGVPTYAFDIASPEGTAWEVECDGRNGKITEIEEEVKAPSEAKFVARMKVSEEEARRTALEKHPGQVIEIDYEIEPDGAASYEFDIVTADGKEYKVEVDATSGKIVEDNEEIYQIGNE